MHVHPGGGAAGGWLWPVVMFSYMLALAYVAAFIVFHTAALLAA